MAISQQDFQAEIKSYRSIFFSLVFLSAVSVGIHYLHLPTVFNMVLILGIAFIQATLSVCYFMHLITERKLIFLVLILTAVFVISMLGLILHGHFDHFEGMHYVS
jgi:cytochrome c oxidase subunit 4